MARKRISRSVSKEFVTSTKLLNRLNSVILGIALLSPVLIHTPKKTMTSEAIKFFDLATSEHYDEFKKRKKKSLRYYYTDRNKKAAPEEAALNVA